MVLSQIPNERSVPITSPTYTTSSSGYYSALSLLVNANLTVIVKSMFLGLHYDCNRFETSSCKNSLQFSTIETLKLGARTNEYYRSLTSWLWSLKLPTKIPRPFVVIRCFRPR